MVVFIRGGLVSSFRLLFLNANTRLAALSTSRARAEKGIGITADLEWWFLGETGGTSRGLISVRVYHEQYEIKQVELVRNKFVPTRRDIS